MPSRMKSEIFICEWGLAVADELHDTDGDARRFGGKRYLIKDCLVTQ